MIRLVKLLYESIECAVLDDGTESEWFRVTTGVKQGCTMSGFLFLLAIDFVMKKITNSVPTGIRWKFTTKLEDLDFADDLALLSSKFQHMQQKTEKLKENASSIGLKINSRKTKVMRLNARIQTPVKIDQTNIEDVETFTYLGGIITSKEGSDEDIDSRIGKGRNQFRRLRKIWTSSIFSIQT
ncbi:uncharacterized protein LOC123533508 [Mercenaria mercenaria]|uniref:uncharacterized protein LOC123533508 n=1 Tax=Mercenaria mercenaria TaxID=6596 RepID=UPI00234F181B|nr:uncharacterized protein LOC123533508 [Mercenaria mercenaria]